MGRIGKTMARRKKKNKNKNIIGKFLATVFTIVMVLGCFRIYTMDLLPIKYLGTCLGFVFIITFVINLLLTKTAVNKHIRTFAGLLATLFIFVMGMGYFYMNETMDFLNNMTNQKLQNVTYYVMVSNDSSATKLSDIKDGTIGVNSLFPIQKAIQSLQNKVAVTDKKYASGTKLVDDVVDQKIEAILISESYKALFEESNQKFKKNTKVIYQFTLAEDATKQKSKIDVTKDVFSVYISGIDTYGSIANVARSDVNILATVNPNTHKILLTSVPRDYYVKLHGVEGYRDKLTHAGVYGIDMSLKTMEDLLETTVPYYLRINFSTLIKSVDALGGIDVYSDTTFTAYNGETFQQGMNHLNGQSALAFARERKVFAGGDRMRGEHQEAVITAMIDKMTSSAMVSNYSQILKSLDGSFNTNMTSKEISALVRKQIDQGSKWTVESFRLDGTDSYNYTYTYDTQQLYVMEPDWDTVSQAIAKINAIGQAN